MKKVGMLMMAMVALISLSCEEKRPEPPCEVLIYGEQLAKDKDLIDQYLSDNGIVAQEHNSGLRYVIVEQGDGETPTTDDQVKTTYRGTFLSNGEVFDESTDGFTFPLNAVIPGWQIGIPLIQEGGKIMLYIPSGLAYGACDYNTIPRNSNLVFEVGLIEVIKE